MKFFVAFTEVVNADLALQIKTATNNFKPLLKEATDFWNSNSAKNTYTQAEVDDNKKALADFASQLLKYIAYDTSSMTA